MKQKKYKPNPRELMCQEPILICSNPQVRKFYERWGFDYYSRQTKHKDTHPYQCCCGTEGEEGNVSNLNETTYADTHTQRKKIDSETRNDCLSEPRTKTEEDNKRRV